MPHFEEEPKLAEPKEIWLISYADLVTLMLAFFILLFSFCNVDVEKLKTVAESFKPLPPGSPFFFEGRESVVQGIAQRLETRELAEDVFISVDRRGVVVSFKATALFDSGTADLTERAHKTLGTFVAYLFGLPNDVIIEGHTDDEPIRGAIFPSNWELSAARASAVARFFEGEGVKGQRMQVVGFSQFRPRFRNDTPQKRALNRRIDVIIKPD